MCYRGPPHMNGNSVKHFLPTEISVKPATEEGFSASLKINVSRNLWSVLVLSMYMWRPSVNAIATVRVNYEVCM